MNGAAIFRLTARSRPREIVNLCFVEYGLGLGVVDNRGLSGTPTVGAPGARVRGIAEVQGIAYDYLATNATCPTPIRR